MRAFLIALALSGLAACTLGTTASSSPHPDAGVSNGAGCSTAGADGKCGAACTSDTGCSAATYCSTAGRCTADCVVYQAQCGAGWQCGAHGRCVANPTSADGGDGCPRVEVTAANQIPTVLLLIDQSGSMTTDFGGGLTRWQAVVKALVDPANGVVYKLQDKVKFAVTMYTSHGGTAGGTCPILTPADLSKNPPALNNADAIAKLVNAAKPDSDTPTGESINAVVPGLLAAGAGIEGSGGPVAILLATDGEPDSCAIPNPTNATQQGQTDAVAVKAAQDAYAKGVATIVLGVGSQTDQANLQDMANAGAGVATGATYYQANDPTALASSFDQIIRGVRTCVFRLSGSVADGKQSQGLVSLNGTPLTYNDPNGWTLSDSDTLELLGTACSTFKDSDPVSLEASFPCGSVTIN